MDGQRFDLLARAVRGSRSRRGMLRGLAGVVTLVVLDRRAQNVAAQVDQLNPGDPCQFDAQCADSGMICDYVGQTGDFRCCAGESGRCGGDADCGGWLVCPPGDFNGAFCVSACTGASCPGIAGTPGTCGAGLMCCAQGDPGAPGLCLAVDACSVSMAACASEGCDCAVADPNACNDGLFCCGPGEAGAIGACQTPANC